MPTLSQLIKASYEINQLIAASEEITPELEIQIQLMAMAWRDKVDGYKFIMDKMNSDSEALKVIAHEYLTISKRLSSQAEWMKGCLKTYMEGKGKNILRGQNEDAILSPSDPSVEIFDESKIPDQFIRIERIPKKIEIKEALKAGELVPGAQLKSLGTKLRWKKHAKQIGDIHEIRPKNEDTRNFLKLKDGESIKGIFRGDIYEFRIHWTDNRSSVCPGKETCDLCKSGDKSKFRFRVNFIVKEGSDYTSKVIEQGWTFYEILRSINDGDYELEKYVMKITRQGSGLHTSYSVIPAPDGLVHAELETKLSAVTLNNLGHITEAETEPHSIPEFPEIPF